VNVLQYWIAASASSLQQRRVRRSVERDPLKARPHPLREACERQGDGVWEGPEIRGQWIRLMRTRRGEAFDGCRVHTVKTPRESSSTASDRSLRYGIEVQVSRAAIDVIPAPRGRARTAHAAPPSAATMRTRPSTLGVPIGATLGIKLTVRERPFATAE